MSDSILECWCLTEEDYRMWTAAKVHNLKSFSQIAAFSLQGRFALWGESLNRTLANSLCGTSAPGNFHFLELSLMKLQNFCFLELSHFTVYSTIYWSHVHAMKNLHGPVASHSNHRLKYLSRPSIFVLLCGGSCHNEPTLTGQCVLIRYCNSITDWW